MSFTNPLIVVPARFHSTRLPEKLIQLIHGKPIISWVCERIRQANIARLVVATDSELIKKICEQDGYECIMTSEDYGNGTERVAYVADLMSSHDYFINVQADEPLINTLLISEILHNARETAFNVAVSEITDIEKNNPNEVKVALSCGGRMRYASRQLIPFGRDTKTPIYKIHGVYGYTISILENFLNAPMGPLEKVEKVEQLRCIENDIPIYGVITPHTERSIDTQADFQYMKNLPLSSYLEGSV